VNDRNAINRVRMGVVFAWTTMSCPARVADAYPANQRLAIEHALQVLEFSHCASPRQETMFKRGNSGGIISSIFQPSKCIQNRRSGRPSTDETDDSTHLPSPIVRPSATGTRVRYIGKVMDRAIPVSSVTAPDADWRSGVGRE
jgi:hypothetical protein